MSIPLWTPSEAFKQASGLAVTQLPGELANWVKGSGLAPMLVMAAILVIYIVLGCVMDSLAMILLTIPIFYPVVMGHGRAARSA